MTRPRVLFAAKAADWPIYRHCLSASLQRLGMSVELVNLADTPDHDPASIDYIIYAPNAPLQDFTPYRRLKLVLSLWAGVERFQANPTLVQPLARMVDPGLREGMADWVSAHVLRYHLGLDQHILNQDGIWRTGAAPPLARSRHVGLLGLGSLGLFCANRLKSNGFQVSGWSRRQKSATGIECYSGRAGLKTLLTSAEILVLLLPQTAQTEHILNAQTLAMMPRGAYILNPGRGPLIDDAALLSALDSGQIAHATLDVFAVEPLAADDAYWAHPSVTVTPHIASETRPETAADAIAENIRRGEAGEAFLHLVDRARGY
jgi:glyoxylate/hydroxypyruvate reductase A